MCKIKMSSFTTFDNHRVDGTIIKNMMKEKKYLIKVYTSKLHAILSTKIREHLQNLNIQNYNFSSFMMYRKWMEFSRVIKIPKAELIAVRFNELSPQWMRKTDNSIVREWFAGRLAEPWWGILHGPVCKTTDHGRLPRPWLATIYHDRAAASEVVT